MAKNDAAFIEARFQSGKPLRAEGEHPREVWMGCKLTCPIAPGRCNPSSVDRNTTI